MDHRVHPSEAVHRLRQLFGVLSLGEVADNEVGAAGDKIVECGGALLVAGMHDDVVSRVEELLGGVSAQSLRRTGDEDSCHDRCPSGRDHQ